MITETLMKGKTVVVTGGTSGIGEVAAIELAKMGARIVLVARDNARGKATLARLRHSAPGIAHSVHFANLLRLAKMKRVADQIAEQESRIDVLINNAGALFATRKLTEDGLERTFALNHMAYFVITERLRERLSALGTARIITTASAAHYGVPDKATVEKVYDNLDFQRGLQAVEEVERPDAGFHLVRRHDGRRNVGRHFHLRCRPRINPLFQTL